MNCPKCNAYVPENSKFCSQCGAVIEAAEKPIERDSRAQETSENFQSGYTYGNGNYRSANQSPYPNGNVYTGGYGYYENQPSGELTAHLNSTFSIIVLIVNIVFFNLIGVILSALSVRSYNRYENELRNRNFHEAEILKSKSKRYAKIALIVQIIYVVLFMIAGIAAVVLYLSRAAETDPAPFYFNEFFSEELLLTAKSFLCR